MILFLQNQDFAGNVALNILANYVKGLNQKHLGALEIP